MFAAALGRPGTPFAEIRTIHKDETKAFDISDIFRRDVSEEIAILEQTSGLAATTDEIPRIERDIAIWRDPRWIAPDPVESVLSRSADCVRVERMEELILHSTRVKVAIAEPGTLEWERLATVAPVIALHRGTLRPEPLPKGVDEIRMPLPIHLLLHRIEKATN